MAAGVVHFKDDELPKPGNDLNASTLVLLPGLEATGNLFADFVSQLPPMLKVIVCKYPAQKFLSYDQLLPLVTELVPRETPFTLVAESFSTPLAAMFAATHPPNLVGLVMCAGFVTNPARNWTLLAGMLARRAVLRIPPPRWFLHRFVMGNDPSTSLECNFRKALQAVAAEVLAARLRAILDCDAREELRRTEIPLLYIQAECDRLVPPESFEGIRRIRPDAELVKIPGAPHLVLQREPRKCAQAIVRFVDILDPANTR
jgi:pimeloyl-[acyl-carrier protein] methyl ester esterase